MSSGPTAVRERPLGWAQSRSTRARRQLRVYGYDAGWTDPVVVLERGKPPLERAFRDGAVPDEVRAYGVHGVLRGRPIDRGKDTWLLDRPVPLTRCDCSHSFVYMCLVYEGERLLAHRLVFRANGWNGETISDGNPRDGKFWQRWVPPVQSGVSRAWQVRKEIQRSR